MPRKGETMSAEDREKRRIALAGRPRPESVKAKISSSHIGLKHSETTKRKISEVQKGKPVPPGTLANLQRMAQERVGQKRPARSQEWIDKLSEANRGRKRSPEEIEKISKSLKGNMRCAGREPWNKGRTGLGGYKWSKPTKTAEHLLLRGSVQYAEWRTAVFERDGYTCQDCGQHGGKLNADHIKPFAHFPDLRFDLSNGRTLCVSCHRQTDTYGLKLVHARRKHDAAKAQALAEKTAQLGQ